jgi:cell division protein FtsZ
MTISLSAPKVVELKPRIVVIGVGGAGGNAVNNMIDSGLEGVEFIVTNTDAQALAAAKAERRIQLGTEITQGLGCGAQPEIGRAAAEESMAEIMDHMNGTHMAFVAAGMGGGTGTGAAPVIAQVLRDSGILTIGVVTKPFQFEGTRRMRTADSGIDELQHFVDTLIVIPNQNLFRLANEKTTFADAFAMADNVLHSGVRGITDLMVMPGLINLDFADVKTVMGEMGKAMMGTGEAEGDKRAVDAAESAISNPLLDEVSMKGARGVLINITGGSDLTLYEMDEAANRIREEVDPDANIIVGSALDENLSGAMRVSVVATGIDAVEGTARPPVLRPQVAAVAARLSPAPESTPVEAAPLAETAPAPSPEPAPIAQEEPEAPRISEIMSRLEETRRAVPKAKPIAPEPQAIVQPTAPLSAPEVNNEPFIAPPAAAPEQASELKVAAPITRTPVRAPEPELADASNEVAAPQKGRLSLFARMTGGGRPAATGDPVEKGLPLEQAIEEAKSTPAEVPAQEPQVALNRTSGSPSGRRRPARNPFILEASGELRKSFRFCNQVGNEL